MNFSELVKILYPFCGAGEEEAEFVVTLTNNIMNEEADEVNPLADFTPDYRKRLYKGTKTIGKTKVTIILKHIDKIRLEEYFKRLPEDALQSISDSLKKYGLETNPHNAAFDCAELLENILKSIVTGEESLKILPVAQTVFFNDKFLTKKPPVLGRNLLHRDDKVKDISAELKKNSHARTLIAGFGGVGKTSVASAVFHECEKAFNHIAWVDCSNEYTATNEDENSFISRFANSVTCFNENIKASERYRLSLTFLNNSTDKTLIFFDNANNPNLSELNELLGIGAKIVLISRTEKIEDFTTFDIDFLSENECADIFYHYYDFEKYDKNKQFRSVVDELVRLVSRHTLSIELLAKGANCLDYKNGLDDYLSELKRHGFGFPDFDFISVYTKHNNFESTVASHLKILFDMQLISDTEKHIVKNFCVMPDLEIPAEVWKWLGCRRTDLKKTIKLGWINERENGYYMHSIVKQVIELQYTIIYDDCTKFIDYMSGENYAKANEPFLLARVKLGVAYSVGIRFENENRENLCDFYNQIASAYEEQAEFSLAVEWFEKSFRVHRFIRGENHHFTGTLYNNMATVFLSQGLYDKAFEYFRKSLDITEKFLGKESEEVASTYCNIGAVYSDMGDYDQALKNYKQALKITKKIYGADSIEAAEDNSQIGVLYTETSNFEKGLKILFKVLDIFTAELDDNHPSIAKTYSNIGFAYYKIGDFETSLEWYKKGLDILKFLYGEEHPYVVDTYNNMATSYCYLGDFKLTMKLHFDALKIRKKIFGDIHPDVATSYNDIAFALNQQDKYDEAFEYATKALEIKKIFFPDIHPSIAATYEIISETYDGNGDYKTALDYLFKALNIHLEIYGEESEQTAEVYNGIGCNFLNLNDSKKAHDYLMKSLGIKVRILGEKHADTLIVYNNIADVFSYDGDYETAFEWKYKALEICEEIFGADHPDTAIMYNNISVNCIELGEFELALQYAELAYPVLKETFSSENFKTKTTEDTINMVKNLLKSNK